MPSKSININNKRIQKKKKKAALHAEGVHHLSLVLASPETRWEVLPQSVFLVLSSETMKNHNGQPPENQVTLHHAICFWTALLGLRPMWHCCF